MLDFFLEWAKQPTSRAVVLKNPGLMMAQVKGPTFNFYFPSRWFLLFPQPKLGKFPKVLIYERLREDKARLGLCGKLL